MCYNVEQREQNVTRAAEKSSKVGQMESRENLPIVVSEVIQPLKLYTVIQLVLLLMLHVMLNIV